MNMNLTKNDTDTKKALIVIDIQNDYFPDGNFPLWNTDKTLNNILSAIKSAQNKDIPIILIQHVSSDPHAQFFAKGSKGVKLHPLILERTPNAKIVIKNYADAFYQTELEKVLSEYDVNELLITGMMTQNCVTHTALSKSAEKYKIKILQDCTTTVNEAIHYIALDAISTRIELANFDTIR